MRIAILGGGVAGLTCAHYLAHGGPHAGGTRDRRERSVNSARRSCTRVCASTASRTRCGTATLHCVACSPTSADSAASPGADAFGGLDGRRVLPGQHAAPTCCALPGWCACPAATGCARDSASPTRPSSSATRCTSHGVAAAEWLPRVFGRRVFEAWWRPFLESALRRVRPTRFRRTGSGASSTPTRPVAARCSATCAAASAGSASGCAARSRRAAARCGSTRRSPRVETGGPHCSVEVDGAERRFDAVVSTLAARRSSRSWRGGAPRARAAQPGRAVPGPRHGAGDPAAPPRRVLPDRVPRHGRAVPAHASRPPTSCPRESLGGRHLIYVRNECGPHTDAFKLPDDVVRKQALESLRRWFPAFDPRDVEAVHVSHNGAAEPITLFGNLRRQIPTRIPNTRVFLCTSAQAYPRRAGWDTDVTLARETAAAVVTASDAVGAASRVRSCATPKEDHVRRLREVACHRRRWAPPRGTGSSALPSCRSWRFAAGVDPDPERRAEIEARGAHAFASVNELLAVGRRAARRNSVYAAGAPARARRAAAAGRRRPPDRAAARDDARRRRPDRRAGRTHRPGGHDDRPVPRRPRPGRRGGADRRRAPSAGWRAVEVALSQQARRARRLARRPRALGRRRLARARRRRARDRRGARRPGPAHPHARAREPPGRRGRGRGAHRDRARRRRAWACCACPGTKTRPARSRAASAIAASSRWAGRRRRLLARGRHARSHRRRARPVGDAAAVLRAFLRERRSRERRVDPGAQSLAWLHAAYRSIAARGRFEIA